MTHEEIRKRFRDFFESKGHKWIESASLLPTDPSVLFTTAGMQQFKQYYTEPDKAPAQNVISIQKCMRTSDIDEVGDESHLTFFEMLGNFSFGGYWKKEAIQYAYDFITKELGLKIDYVSVFKGEEGIPADAESEEIWKNIDSNIKIVKAGREDNFWGPTGNEGPCGPTTEVYVDGVEIWNIVFNEFYCHSDKHLEPLKTKGIDTGMGLERLAMVVQKKKNIFETDLFESILEKVQGKFDDKVRRIIVDHARAIIFLISEGIIPSNKEQGYVLRRLIRRLIAQQAFGQFGLMNSKLGDGINLSAILKEVVSVYKDSYPELTKVKISIFEEESEKYGKTIQTGIKEIAKLNSIDAKQAFYLFESFGLPYEAIKDIADDKAKNLTREAFDEEFKKHQEKSRAGAEKKFGGHGIIKGDLSAADEKELEIKTRLHTATHLLHAALRKVLGEEVHQQGSDITAERLRFDFSFSRKMTTEEIKEVEDLVNKVIKDRLSVTKKEMPYEEALKSGALAFFKQKYPERVNVYSIGDFSKELCGGPHVNNTEEIGKFKITKEESVSAGVRRIRATVE